MRFASTFGLTSVISAAAIGQVYECPPEFYDLIMPPALAESDQYGASMVSAGDWLFVGAPADDQVETDAGAVYVFQIDKGIYEFRQKLLATGGVGPAHFGFSLAAHGDVLIIGAENDREITQSNPSAWGAAYVFQFEGNQWIQQQKLFAFDAGDARQFGYAVAIENDLIVVGAKLIANDIAPGKGAAYVFRRNGSASVAEQRLTSDAPSLFDAFGTAVAIAGDQILVGSSGNDDMAVNAGAVYVFAHDGVQWVQQAKLYATATGANARFSEAISIDANTLIVGAPNADESGAVFVLIRNGDSWNPVQKLVAFNPTPGEQFGMALGICTDTILVGAPNRSSILGENVGSCHVFRLVEGSWLGERRLDLLYPIVNGDSYYHCWFEGPQNWPDVVQFTNNRFGAGVAITSLHLFASSTLVRPLCWTDGWPEDAGALYRFDRTTPMSDCLLSVGFEQCGVLPDCDGNTIPDVCDLASGSSDDCNLSGTPDQCEAGVTYELHNCSYPTFVLGSVNDFIWLNQHRVKPGGQVITHISLFKSTFVSPQTQATVLLYRDPNNDGDPTDAVLLATADTTNTKIYSYLPLAWAIVDIPPTYVGPVGTSFFFGAIVRAHPGGVESLATVCAGLESPVRRSWRASSPAGTADIYNLANNANPVTLVTNYGPFFLRAIGADCNANDTWDSCDIANGTLPDVNGNGIPDECEVDACVFADLAPSGGDGVVNVVDLLHIINNWGVCNPCYAICPGDTNDDCATNVIDLLAVLNSWGPCQ